MNRDEVLLRAIEEDLPKFHRQRMAQRQGEQSAALAAERSKASPNPEVIEQLRLALIQTERDKRDTSITEREVLEPLRQRLQQVQHNGVSQSERFE